MFASEFSSGLDESETKKQVTDVTKFRTEIFCRRILKLVWKYDAVLSISNTELKMILLILS